MTRSSESRSISAVIPAFNRERTIARALESVLRQSRPPDEIIVVDDGSTDRTCDEVQHFAQRVRFLRQENAGASEARNRGVREATSEWVAFLDSDDYWLEPHLERMIGAIEGTEGRADLYFADIRVTPEEGGQLMWDLSRFRVTSPFQLIENATSWAMQDIQPMMLQSSVFRRQAYLAAGGLRPELRCRHDTYLFFLMCLGRAACAVPGCGAIMTSEDRSGGRVTSRHGDETAGYWEETVLLYRDILAGPHPLSARDRRALRARITGAHLRLARHTWARRDLGATLSQVTQAAWAHPLRFLQGLGRVVRRGAKV